MRFSNRKNVDELLQPILSLDIIDKFKGVDIMKANDELFPELPERFSSPIEYADLWTRLNLYETFNQLINQRNESEKDAELSRLYNFKVRNTKKPNFLGSVSRRKPSDDKNVYLNLNYVEEKKTADKANMVDVNQRGFKDGADILYSLKEFDLILLSREK